MGFGGRSAGRRRPGSEFAGGSGELEELMLDFMDGELDVAETAQPPDRE